MKACILSIAQQQPHFHTLKHNHKPLQQQQQEQQQLQQLQIALMEVAAAFSTIHKHDIINLMKQENRFVANMCSSCQQCCGVASPPRFFFCGLAFSSTLTQKMHDNWKAQFIWMWPIVQCCTALFQDAVAMP